MPPKVRKMNARLWFRDSAGRLQRITSAQNIEEDWDLIMLGTTLIGAPQGLIAPVRLSNIGTNQTSPLAGFLLPNELFVDYIVRYLSVEDVINLGKTCRALEKKINNLFVVESVVLPLSPDNKKKLQGRYVLDLTSSGSVGLWQEARHLDVVKEMNLSRMKKLKFNGPNFTNYNYKDTSLSTTYVDCLSHFMSQGTHLTSLDMLLIDGSQQLQDLVLQASKLTMLEEVTFRESGLTLGNGPNNDFRPLNKLLKTFFSRSRARKFTLKGITLRYRGEKNCNQLEIVAPSLETLKICSRRTMGIGRIMCGNLKEMILEESYWGGFCLYHNQCVDDDGWLPDYAPGSTDRMGRLAPMLYTGCPRLEKFNDLDLRPLRELNTDGDWLEELEHHKGLGANRSGGGTSCTQCGIMK